MSVHFGRAWALVRFYKDFAYAGVSYLISSKGHKAMSSLTPLGTVEKLSETVTRVLGHNPGPFTLQGTNTYVLGTGTKKILVDTGEPNITDYILALKNVLKDSELECIIITHWHGDHVGGIDNIVSEILNNKKIPIYKMQRNGDEGVERFEYVTDGHTVSVDGATLKFVHTPGHTVDHFALWLEEENSLFSGDCILGEGTTVFEDLHDYMESLQKIKDMKPTRIYPGHGPVITKAEEKVNEYIEHRMKREREIIAVLEEHEELSSMDITNTVYQSSPWAVRLAALNNVKLVLNKLVKDGVVQNVAFEMYKFIGDEHKSSI